MATKSMPVFLVGCGCFNPPTMMHLRMFEIGRDWLKSCKTRPLQVLGGIISPAHDSYEKPGLLPSSHRNAMIKLAVDNYPFVRLSTWETEQKQWTRTRKVLDTYKQQLEGFTQGLARPEWLSETLTMDQVTNARLFLICGEDLLESFNVPGLWSPDDIAAIVGNHGLVVLSRGGSKGQEMVDKSDVLFEFRENIFFVTSDMGTDISSTKVRLAVRRNRSVKFIIDDKVNDYIRQHKLYQQHEYDVQSLSRTKRLNLTQQRDSVHLSLSSPYFVRRHPVKSPQRTPSKSVQCGLDRRQLHRSESVDSLSLASSQATLPNTKFMTLQLPSKDKAKGGKKKKSAKREEVKETDKDKEKKQLKKTNSESAILIKLSSKGIRITSHEESFL